MDSSLCFIEVNHCVSRFPFFSAMDEEFFTEHCIFDSPCEFCPLRNLQISCCLRSRDGNMQMADLYRFWLWKGHLRFFGKVNWIAEFSKYSSPHVSYRRFVSYSTVNQLLRRSSRLIFKSSLPSQDPLRRDKTHLSSSIPSLPSAKRSEKLSFSDPVKFCMFLINLSESL